MEEHFHSTFPAVPSVANGFVFRRLAYVQFRACEPPPSRSFRGPRREDAADRNPNRLARRKRITRRGLIHRAASARALVANRHHLIPPPPHAEFAQMRRNRFVIPFRR